MVRKMPKIIKSKQLYRYCWNNVKNKDKGAYFIILGSPGCGKSTLALKFCSDLQPELNGKEFTLKHVVYSLRDFTELLISKETKSGDCIIFDEIAGSDEGASSRSAMTNENKDMNYIITTIRAKKLILFYVAPMLKQIDSITRVVGVDGKFEMKTIDFGRKLSKANFAWSLSNHTTGKIYYPYPRLRDPSTKELFYSKVKCFALPPKELNDAYKEKKMEFLNANLKKINLKYSKETEDSKKKMSFAEALKEVRENKEKYLSKGRIEWGYVAEHLGVSPNLARQISTVVTRELATR